MSLSHRERVIKALSHKEPDRIPFDLGGTINSGINIVEYQKLKAYFGVEAEDTLLHKWQQLATVHEPILKALDVDFRCVMRGAPQKTQDIPVGEDAYQDEWGVVRRKPAGSHYYDIVKCPLTGPITINDITNFPWPDPHDPGYTSGMRERLLDLHDNTDYAITLHLPNPSIFVTQAMRGFEDWFLDVASDHKLSGALFDAALEWSTAQSEDILKAGGDLVDVVVISEDLGFQNGPMVSPELYRKLFKPRLKKYFDTAKKHTSAFMHLHCCGSVYQIMDEIIELGVDVLNPVQVAAKDMDSSILGPEFGDRLGFWGGVDTQQVLPNGRVEDVKAEVKRRIRDFAPGGGYVLGAVHNIQYGVPVENIIALFEAGKEYGSYPIAIED